MLIKANPDKNGTVNAGLACAKGKWGFDCSMLENKLEEPLIKYNGEFREADYHEALVMIAKKCQAVGTKYGKDSVAVSISDRYTNEEAYAIKKMAEAMDAKVLCMNNRKSGIADVIGHDASPNTIDEMLSTDLILAVGFNGADNPVIQLKMRQAAAAGAKVVLINPEGYEQNMNYLAKEVYTANDLSFIKALAKAVADSGKGGNIAGFDEFAASVADADVTDEVKEIADMYLDAKKAMIVFTQNMITANAATLLADIAMVSGHIGAPRDGILQVKAKNNSQGLIDMGITAGAEALDGVKALVVFGEEADIDADSLEFMAVCDTHMTPLAAKSRCGYTWYRIRIHGRNVYEY